DFESRCGIRTSSIAMGAVGQGCAHDPGGQLRSCDRGFGVCGSRLLGFARSDLLLGLMPRAEEHEPECTGEESEESPTALRRQLLVRRRSDRLGFVAR